MSPSELIHGSYYHVIVTTDVDYPYICEYTADGKMTSIYNQEDQWSVEIDEDGSVCLSIEQEDDLVYLYHIEPVQINLAFFKYHEFIINETSKIANKKFVYPERLTDIVYSDKSGILYIEYKSVSGIGDSVKNTLHLYGIRYHYEYVQALRMIKLTEEQIKNLTEITDHHII